MNLKSPFFFTLFIFCFLTTKSQFYNGSQIDFGKNRIQYRNFEWNYVRFDHVDVYFYEGGKDAAIETATIVESLIEKLNERFDYELESRLQIMVFNKLGDLKQSNIGLSRNMSDKKNVVSNFVDNKVLIYQETGFQHLRKQIYEGVAEAYYTEYLFGSDVRSRLKNAALFNLPDWFIPGLVQFTAQYWNSKVDDELRNYILSNNIKKLWRFDHALAGYAVWHFIHEVYGVKTMVNLLDLTRTYRNVNDAANYLIGTNIKGILQECSIYFDKRYYYQDTQLVTLKNPIIRPKFKKKSLQYAFASSHDANHLAWVSNDKGKLWVNVFDKKASKKLVIAKMKHRSESTTDFSYPLLAWHPNLPLLLMVDEVREKIRLSFYDVEKKAFIERRWIFNVDKILSLNYTNNGKKILVSALRDSHVDIGFFDLASNTFKWISNDAYDDLNPTMSKDGQVIYFASNRLVDSLVTKNYQAVENGYALFALKEPFDASALLIRLTNNGYYSLKQLEAMGKASIVFSTNENGIQNLQKATIDSAIAFVDTSIHYRYTGKINYLSNYSGNLIDFTPWQNDSLLVFVNRRGNQKLYSIPFEEKSKAPPLSNWAKLALKNPHPFIDSSPTWQRKKSDSNSGIDLNRYRFFDEKSPIDTSKAQKTAKKPRLKQRYYETTYFSDGLKIDVDRSFLNQTYQNFSPNGYQNPPFSGLMKLGVMDVFENHHLALAMRAGLNLSGNEYLLSYVNYKKRTDHFFSFHRVGFSTRDVNTFLHTAKYKYQYIISENARVALSMAYRNDRAIYLSNEFNNLIRPDEYSHWQVNQVEYVLDQTFQPANYYRIGFRFKAWAEWYKKWNTSGIHTTVLGFDARHYLNIFRGLVFANRLAGSASFGPRNVIFFLGGVDNALAPRYDNSLAIDLNQNYIFQALGTNMRGFFQNARNGNRMLVSNHEIRWPIYRFFSPYPSRSNFINHFNLKAFFDIGTAFTGSSPYSASNTFNQQTTQNGPITVTLFNLRNPILYSYGLGASTKVLGYMVRIDYAQGIDTGEKLRPLWHISFAHDF